MRIVLLTQDDSFYLPKNLEYLIENLKPKHQIVSCVLFKASPFGKKLSFFQKASESVKVFGVRFFIYYGVILFLNRFFKGTSVAKVLHEKAVPITRLQNGVNHPSSLELIKKLAPDLLVSIAGNQIFKKQLIELAPRGCINLHSALLPKYRGLMPSFWVLRFNETETGVSVFFVDEGIDSGPIIIQKKLMIGNMTQQELIRETKKLGMIAIVEAISQIERNSFALKPNTEAEMTYFSFPTSEDVKAFRKAGKKFF